MSEPVAVIKASRRRGHAVVTVERVGRPARRHRVSLRRYAALRQWTHGDHPWKRSGEWSRSSLAVYLWEVTDQTS